MLPAGSRGPPPHDSRKLLFTSDRGRFESSVTEQYEKIFAQDIRFTQAIEAGEMTRTERSERNRASRLIIETNEKTAAVGSDAQRKADRERFINDQMEALLRIQRMPAMLW